MSACGSFQRLAPRTVLHFSYTVFESQQVGFVPWWIPCVGRADGVYKVSNATMSSCPTSPGPVHDDQSEGGGRLEVRSLSERSGFNGCGSGRRQRRCGRGRRRIDTDGSSSLTNNRPPTRQAGRRCRKQNHHQAARPSRQSRPSPRRRSRNHRRWRRSLQVQP